MVSLSKAPHRAANIVRQETQIGFDSIELHRKIGRVSVEKTVVSITSWQNDGRRRTVNSKSFVEQNLDVQDEETY